MSFVNVGCMGASAAPTVAGRTRMALVARAPTIPLTAFGVITVIISAGPRSRTSSLSDRDSDVGIRPAALKTAAAFARFVIGLDSHYVSAGGTEGCRGTHHFSLFGGLQTTPGKGHVARTPVLVQRHGRDG